MINSLKGVSPNVLKFTTVAWSCKPHFLEHWLPYDTPTGCQFARSKTLVFSILSEDYIKFNVNFSGKRGHPSCKLKTRATIKTSSPAFLQNKCFQFITWSVFSWPSVVLFTPLQMLLPPQNNLPGGVSTCHSLQPDTLAWNKMTDFKFMHSLQAAAHSHVYFCLVVPPALIKSFGKRFVAWIEGSNCSSQFHEFHLQVNPKEVL